VHPHYLWTSIYGAPTILNVMRRWWVGRPPCSRSPSAGGSWGRCHRHCRSFLLLLRNRSRIPKELHGRRKWKGRFGQRKIRVRTTNRMLRPRRRPFTISCSSRQASTTTSDGPFDDKSTPKENLKIKPSRQTWCITAETRSSLGSRPPSARSPRRLRGPSFALARGRAPPASACKWTGRAACCARRRDRRAPAAASPRRSVASPWFWRASCPDPPAGTRTAAQQQRRPQPKTCCPSRSISTR